MNHSPNNYEEHENGFTIFHKKYNKAVYKAAYHFTGCRHLALDIQQDIFLKLWEQKDILKEVKTLESYLFICVRNTYLNMLKKRKRERESNLFFTGDSIQFDHDLEEQLLYNMVKIKAVEKLPTQQKLVFKMAMENGWNYLKIAREMNISPSTVKKHRASAISSIYTYLKQIA